MALDKQRILNELGSVMTQLQSADCGCMGKLFSNPNDGQRGGAVSNHQPSSGCGSFGGCRGGCCHNHGGFSFGHRGVCNASGGEPLGSHFMGNCNPKKAYAETYNYLNQNLMQPVVNEVYNDLKTITPENTVMNNTMAAKMGLPSQGGNPTQGGNPIQGGNSIQGGNYMQGGNTMQGGNAMQVGYATQGGYDMQGGNTMQHANYLHGGNAMDSGYHGGANPVKGGYSVGGYAMQGAHRMQADMGIEQNQMMESGMSSHIRGANQRNMYMPESQIQGGVSDMYQMQDTMQGDTSMGNQNSMNGNQSPQQMANPNMHQMMGGMGPNIVKMMRSESNAKPISSTPQKSQMPGSMLIDAPQSPHGQIGVTPLNVAGDINQGQYNIGAFSNNHNQQMLTPTNQYVADPNMTTGFNLNEQNNNVTNSNMQQSHVNLSPGQLSNSNPAAQQMASSNHSYGQHSQGMKKFNEMFPGVIGGDLGFDPMAIAIQMNPKNHQKAAMDTMEKMISGKKGQMNATLAGTNAATLNLAQGNVAPINQQNAQSVNQQLYGQPGLVTTPLSQNQQYGGNINATVTPAHQVQEPQQVYDETNSVHQQPPQQIQTQQQQYNQFQQQQIINSKTGAPLQQNLPPTNEGATENSIAQMQQQQAYETTLEPTSQPELMIKDPIFPADTTAYHLSSQSRRPRYYQYNTLGQPIEVLPQRLIKTVPETDLPQTLSPQPGTGKLRKDIARFNIKSTVSKTSLVANKPVGKAPSRQQLQNIYNQYKGSHSHTQQSIRNQAPQSETYSEGRLGAPQQNVNKARDVPVERIGGDTIANNQAVVNQTLVKEHPVQPGHQHIGDVPMTNKPHGDIISPTTESPVLKSNYRNGLQDLDHLPYQTTAWTFHGEQGSSFSPFRRYRTRA